MESSIFIDNTANGVSSPIDPVASFSAIIDGVLIQSSTDQAKHAILFESPSLNL